MIKALLGFTLRYQNRELCCVYCIHIGLMVQFDGSTPGFVMVLKQAYDHCLLLWGWLLSSLPGNTGNNLLWCSSSIFTENV